MFKLSKYKGTIIKLVNPSNGSEIYGYLKDYDEETNMMKISKPIITMNKFIADGANTLNDIIQYKYNSDDGSTIIVPATTIYDNVGDDKIMYLNSSMYLIVPLYDTSLLSVEIPEEKKDVQKLKMKELFENYIEFVYDNFNEMISEISKADTNVPQQ